MSNGITFMIHVIHRMPETSWCIAVRYGVASGMDKLQTVRIYGIHGMNWKSQSADAYSDQIAQFRIYWLKCFSFGSFSYFSSLREHCKAHGRWHSWHEIETAGTKHCFCIPGMNRTIALGGATSSNFQFLSNDYLHTYAMASIDRQNANHA